MFKVVSFYTSEYEEVSERLKASLEKFRVPYYLKAVTLEGKWAKRTQYKCTFLLECLQMFSEPIVWIDSDAELLSYPWLFENIEADIAFYFMDNERQEVLSGTIYLKNNDTVKQILNIWDCQNSINHNWDQVNLQRALQETKHRHFILPPEYCYIKDHPYQTKKLKSEPVIMHYQYSRQIKGLINDRVNKLLDSNTNV